MGKQHLGLAIERQMPSVFGNQHGGDHRLGRQPALDQPFGRRRLNHRFLAGPAGIFGTVGHDHPVLRRDHVEPLRGLLADHMHGGPAARAIGVSGLDRHMHARQVAGKRATIGTALIGAGARSNWVLFVVGSLGARNRLLDVLERQMQLVLIELLRAAAELRPLQLAQKMSQAVIMREGLVALRNRSVTLCARRREKRLQDFDIGWKRISPVGHAQHRIRFARVCESQYAGLIQLVTALTTPPSDAGHQSHAAGTSPSRRRAQPAAMRSIASRRQ